MAGPRPKLLLFGGDGSPSGVPRHLAALAEALDPVSTVTVASEPDQGGYTDLPCRHLSLQGLASSPSPAKLRQGYRGLIQLIEFEKPDLVWFHARIPVILGRWAAINGRLNCPFAVTFHGLPFGRGHRRTLDRFGKRSERYFAQHAPPHQMVFLNEDQKHRMQILLGPLAQRHSLHVLPNMSRLGTIPAPSEAVEGRHLVMTGRAGWQKNLEAAAAILRHLPEDFRLTICGPGTDAPRLAARLRRRAGGAANRLALMGPLQDVRRLLASADGYLLTSRYEGEPIGALEAWEAGLPVMLSPFEGAKGLAQHPHSAVFNSPDPSARAKHIETWLAAYLTDRRTHQAQIKASWAQKHSPLAFAEGARALLAKWL